MRVDVITLFPELFRDFCSASLVGRAIERGLLALDCTNPRDFATDRHRTVDDAPYGGGAGMVLKCDPLFGAVESLKPANSLERVVLLTPKGRRLDQAIVREYGAVQDLVLICGRYEGVDERVAQALCTDEISIGDYVLSGGELPAMVFIEALSRMAPGVVGDWESVETDSFYDGILGQPQYTRPADFRGMAVPEVLKEGNHAAIRRWRRKQALAMTRERRPDLLAMATEEDKALLKELEDEARQANKETGP